MAPMVRLHEVPHRNPALFLLYVMMRAEEDMSNC